jgi:hypothetical protein
MFLSSCETTAYLRVRFYRTDFELVGGLKLPVFYSERLNLCMTNRRAQLNEGVIRRNKRRVMIAVVLVRVRPCKTGQRQATHSNTKERNDDLAQTDDGGLSGGVSATVGNEAFEISALS